MLKLDQFGIASRWHEFLGKLRVVPYVNGTEDFESRIIAPYTEPHRAYHDLTHIEACLNIFNELALKTIRTDTTLNIDECYNILHTLELAIWFHDIVYDPQASNNEERSVDALKQFCKDFEINKNIMNDAEGLIMMTKSHNESMMVHYKLMNDVDLSILGESPKAFWAYEHGIRKEYSFVPDDVYRVERCKIMKHFADKEKHGKLFQTELFYEKFNNQARENLRHLIAYLEG